MELRKEQEKKLNKENADIPFPGWEALEEERRQEKPKIWLTIFDASGNAVRKLDAPAKKGFHRVAWDFRANPGDAVDLDTKYPPERERSGMLMPPGTYKAELSKEVDGEVTLLAGPVSFQVRQMKEGAVKGSAREEIAAYREEVEDMSEAVRALTITVRTAEKRLNAMRVALSRTDIVPGELEAIMHDLNQEMLELDEELNGNRSKDEIGESSPPTVRSRLNVAAQGASNMLYGPTVTQRDNLELAVKAYRAIRDKVADITENRLPALEKRLAEAGAPWIEGQPLPEK